MADTPTASYNQYINIQNPDGTPDSPVALVRTPGRDGTLPPEEIARIVASDRGQVSGIRSGRAITALTAQEQDIQRRLRAEIESTRTMTAEQLEDRLRGREPDRYRGLLAATRRAKYEAIRESVYYNRLRINVGLGLNDQGLQATVKEVGDRYDELARQYYVDIATEALRGRSYAATDALDPDSSVSLRFIRGWESIRGLDQVVFDRAGRATAMAAGHQGMEITDISIDEEVAEQELTEFRRVQDARNAEYKAMELAAEEKRRLATENARKLLKDILPPELWSQFGQFGTVSVFGKLYQYQLRHNQTALLIRLNDGISVGIACLQLTDQEAPPEDKMVAEYLLIKNDEGRYLNTANIQWADGSHSEDRPQYDMGDARRYDAWQIQRDQYGGRRPRAGGDCGDPRCDMCRRDGGDDYRRMLEMQAQDEERRRNMQWPENTPPRMGDTVTIRRPYPYWTMPDNDRGRGRRQGGGDPRPGNPQPANPGRRSE